MHSVKTPWIVSRSVLCCDVTADGDVSDKEQYYDGDR